MRAALTALLALLATPALAQSPAELERCPPECVAWPCRCLCCMEPPPLSPPPPPPPPRINTSRFWYEVSVGAAGTYALDELWGAAQIALTLGRQNDLVAGGLTILGHVGEGARGLRYGGFRLAPGAQFRIGTRVRIGIGIQLGATFIHAITREDDFVTPTLGVWLQPSVDLARSGGGAWFLSARVAGEEREGGAAVDFAASIGYRN
jgi:hypothetical protein